MTGLPTATMVPKIEKRTLSAKPLKKVTKIGKNPNVKKKFQCIPYSVTCS